MNLLSLSKQKTYRISKGSSKGHSSNSFAYKENAEQILGSDCFKDLVKLPQDEALYEWQAVHLVDFYSQSNLLYGSITQYCTPSTCPVMNAGAKYEYHWCDGVQFKRPVKVSAPEYVEFLMTWIQAQIDDESVFPQNIGLPIPREFPTTVKTVFKRLFRVYSHIYHAHFDRIISLGQIAHLNTSFRHFVAFVMEFDLIEKKELAPMKDLISQMDL